MGPYAEVDYNLTLCTFLSRHQHICQSRQQPTSQGLLIWPQDIRIHIHYIIIHPRDTLLSKQSSFHANDSTWILKNVVIY
jgi:hypothetical protein